MTQKAAAKSTAAKPAKSPATDGDDDTSKSSDRWYWLLKAEPVSRFENGVDVKFSIDDLASRKDPEPWDGQFNPLLPAMNCCYLNELY